MIALLLQAAPAPAFALPDGTPPWAAIGATLLLALINTIGLVLVARAQRKGAKDEPKGEAVDVAKLREDAAAALAKAGKAEGEAKTAAESAERVAGDLKKHLEDEKTRRDRARSAAQDREERLVARLDDLKEKVVHQGADIQVIRGRLDFEGRGSDLGGPRRGR